MLTGNLDLSLESIYGVGPVLGIVVFNTYLAGTVPPQMAIVVVLGSGAIAGFINGFVSVRLHVNAFLVTLAAMLFWRGLVIALIPEGIYNLPAGYSVMGGYKIGGVLPAAIVIGALLFGATYVLANMTALGSQSTRLVATGWPPTWRASTSLRCRSPCLSLLAFSRRSVDSLSWPHWRRGR